MSEDKPSYETRILAMVVLPEGREIFDALATKVEIDDEGAGEYLSLSQDEGKIRLDREEWPALRDAIDKMIGEVRP